MLYRFPKLFFDHPEVKLASVGRSVAAYFKLIEQVDYVEGFLTENTLLFVLNGTKKIRLPSGEICINGGDLVLLKRGTYFMSTLIAKEGSYQALMLCMDDDFLKRFMQEYTGMSPVLEAPQFRPLVVPCSDMVLEVRSHIVRHLQAQGEQTARLLQLKLEELFLLLLSGTWKDQVLSFLQQLFDNSVNAIELTVKANLLRPFTLAEYAKMCGMSLSTFKREFARLYDRAPKEWINSERLKHAEFLFRTTDKNVNEVALECGFENTSYFIRRYREQFGTTPHKARRAETAIL